MTYEVGDEAVISYVGKAEEEGADSYVLTGLAEGTTTLTAVVDDSPEKYAGGASFTLTVKVVAE